MIQIVFENSHFVFCDKPSGVLSTPGRPHEKDQRPCLGLSLQDHLNIQIYPVHRLDFEVSGIVLYAKNEKAHRVANSWFEKKLIQKNYRALSLKQNYSHIPDTVKNSRVLMNPSVGESFQWKSLLEKGKRRAYESPRGKPSLTKAKLTGIQAATGYFEWDLEPVTGRSHQLRYEMSRHGFPILGDVLYGSNVHLSPSEIALRSYKLSFTECPEAPDYQLPVEVKVPTL